jgi:hypothetical protein
MKYYESPSCTVDVLVQEECFLVGAGASAGTMGIDQVRPFGAPARYHGEEDDYE